MTGSWCGVCCAVGLVITVLWPLGQNGVNGQVRYSLNELSDAARRVEERLRDLYKRESSDHLLDKGTISAINEHMRILQVDADKLVTKMSSDVTAILNSKRLALKDIVRRLEDASTSYQWSDNLSLNASDMLLMVHMTEDQGPNYNTSGVHVPVEVYEGYPEILNGLKWSSAVNDGFLKNHELDPKIKFQYFASQLGYMRVFPAMKWLMPPIEGRPDLYDARRRPWYIQGSVSPKDMLILMDRSGSVHGQTFTIMKFAVKTLINTLGENDYVNVAAFNESTEWVTNCTEPLVQATQANKKILFEAIDRLTDGGMASYMNALEFAYSAFKEFEEIRDTEEGQGANCHKVIMMFSDGGTDWPQEVLETYTKDNVTKSVRIFTYAVGPHPIPTAVLKQMACETDGAYNVITTKSGVRNKIQDSYIDILAKSQLENRNHTEQFSSVYTSAMVILAASSMLN